MVDLACGAQVGAKLTAAIAGWRAYLRRTATTQRSGELSMRSTTVFLLFLGGHASAQESYWQADTAQEPHRWAFGVEVLRPVIDLISSSGDDSYLRLEGVGQYWLRPDIALRASIAWSEEEEGTEDPTFYTDSTSVTRYTVQAMRNLRIGAGVTIQKREDAFLRREKHFAPLLGVNLLVGREDRSVRNEDQAYERDSSGVVQAVPGTDVVSSQEDRMRYAGFELAPGLSGPIGKRWEVDIRLPIEFTWWTLLERSIVNYPDVPDWWDEPMNFGVRMPRLHVYYRW